MKERLYLNDDRAFSLPEYDPAGVETRFQHTIAEHSLLRTDCHQSNNMRTIQWLLACRETCRPAFLEPERRVFGAPLDNDKGQEAAEDLADDMSRPQVSQAWCA